MMPRIRQPLQYAVKHLKRSRAKDESLAWASYSHRSAQANSHRPYSPNAILFCCTESAMIAIRIWSTNLCRIIYAVYCATCRHYLRARLFCWVGRLNFLHLLRLTIYPTIIDRNPMTRTFGMSGREHNERWIGLRSRRIGNNMVSKMRSLQVLLRPTMIRPTKIFKMKSKIFLMTTSLFNTKLKLRLKTS